MADRLAAGMALPPVRVTRSDGASMTLPDDMDDGYKMVIFFRGSW